MTIIVRGLIADDKGAVFKARQSRYRKEFEIDSRAAQARLTEEADRKRKVLEARISDNDAALTDLRSKTRTQTVDLEQRIARHMERIRKLDQIIASTSADARAEAESARDVVRDSLFEDQLQLKSLTDDAKAKQDRLIAENSRLKTEAMNIASSLPAEQRRAIDLLRAKFDKQIADADVLIADAKSAGTSASNSYDQLAAEYRTKLMGEGATILSEVHRMVRACQPIGCPVYSTVSGLVAANWNHLEPCIAAHMRTNPYHGSGHAECIGDPAAMSPLQSYRSFLNGLSPDDLAAVRANSNIQWLDSVR